MAENSEGSLTFQNIWKDSERKDLLSPSDITIEYAGNPDLIPFSIKLDREKAKDFMKLEGTTGGYPLNIIFLYGEPTIVKQANFFKDDESPLTVIKNFIENTRATFRRGFAAGSHQRIPDHGSEIKVQLGPIYDIAVMSSPKREEDVEVKFKKMVAEVLAHEVGHSRQPTDIKRISGKTVMRLLGGSFVLLDATRRTVLPWAGLAEPTIIGGELVTAATIVQKGIYERVPSERFAREYSSLAAESWAEMLKVQLLSEEQLKKDYIWGEIKFSLPWSKKR